MSIDKKCIYILQNAIATYGNNHNEALDVFSRFINEDDFILINYDMHSDLYFNKIHKTITIANWVNYCLVNNKIKQYYWVYPKYVQNKNIIDRTNNYEDFLFCGVVYKDFNEALFITKKTKDIITGNKINYINKKCVSFGMNPIIKREDVEKLELNITTSENLPDFKDKKILLTIDADYFCNTGFDTINQYNNNISIEILEKNFEEIIDNIYKKNIQPKACFFSVSPIYIPEKYEKRIKEFFSYLCSFSKAI